MTHTTSHQAARSKRPSAAFADHIAEELRRFDEHLRDVRGLTEGTRKDRIRIVGRLLQQKFPRHAVDAARFRPDDIRRFLARQLDARGTHSNASQLAAALRSYFRYRSTCGDRVGALTAFITSPVSWNLASLPRALKPDEAERLLDSFADGLRWPKRGYAIVRCALDMGLRCCEIAHLKLADIDWRKGTVTLRGTKSLRQDILPLPMETGQALADYLRHERFATDHPAIFVRRMAGLDHPITSAAVGYVIKRAFRRIGLSQYSAHALRHTLACRLVENGSSLKEVADVLRHRSLTTTRIYAKLDTPRLARVPLPWPGSES
jgi:site-specific recombinase XerD